MFAVQMSEQMCRQLFQVGGTERERLTGRFMGQTDKEWMFAHCYYQGLQVIQGHSSDRHS